MRRAFFIPLLMSAVFTQAAFVFAGDILYVTNSDAETVSVIDGEK